MLVPVVHFRTVQIEGGLYDKSITMSGRGDGALGSTNEHSKPDIAQPSGERGKDNLKDVLDKGWLPNGF